MTSCGALDRFRSVQEERCSRYSLDRVLQLSLLYYLFTWMVYLHSLYYEHLNHKCFANTEKKGIGFTLKHAKISEMAKYVIN